MIAQLDQHSIYEVFRGGKQTAKILNFGFKSVTMDQIANEIGISKKTIYNFFENKKQLVHVVTNGMFVSITAGIKQIKKE